MARPLRIEMPGGVHHVTTRGWERRDVVRDDEDRANWLRLLDRVAARCEWRVYARALMRHHWSRRAGIPGDAGGPEKGISPIKWLLDLSPFCFLYEIFAQQDNDNPNDDDFGLIGWTIQTGETGPEASLIAMETIRDLANEHSWSDDQITRVQQVVVVHEIGHHFKNPGEEDHDFTVPQPNSVMWAPSSDAEESLLPLVPLKFRDEAIKRIRKDFGQGKRP